VIRFPPLHVDIHIPIPVPGAPAAEGDGAPNPIGFVDHFARDVGDGASHAAQTAIGAVANPIGAAHQALGAVEHGASAVQQATGAAVDTGAKVVETGAKTASTVTGATMNVARQTMLLPLQIACSASLSAQQGLGDIAGGAVRDVHSVFQNTRPETDELYVRQLRRFLVDVIKASEDREQAPRRYREAIANNRELMISLLERPDVRALLVAADVPADAPPELVPALRELRRLVPGAVVDVGHAVAARVVEQLLAAPPAREALLHLLPDEFFRQASDAVNAEIEGLKFSEQEMVKVLLDPEKGVDLSDVPAKFKDLMQEVMLKYFDRLPLAQKRKLILAALELPVNAPLAVKLSALLNSSGPAIQKLFQLIGNNTKAPLVREVMDRLKDDITPMDDAEAFARIEEALGRPSSEVFAHLDRRPVAAATIGQVHLGKLHDGEKVVAKVSRPNLRPQVAGEFQGLRSLATQPLVKEILDDLHSAIEEELDLRIEAENMERGARVYDDPKIGLAACKLAKGVEPAENLLVQHLAPGKGMGKWTPEAIAAAGLTEPQFLELKESALFALLQRWFENAVFGDGFLHADLHEGNIFLDLRPGEGPGYLMTLIDFGSCDTLSTEEQNALKLCGTGVAFGAPPLVNTPLTRTAGAEVVLYGLSRLAAVTPAQRQALRGSIVEILEREGTLFSKLADILKRCIDLEVKLPRSVLQFNRGRMFLEQQLEAVFAARQKLDPRFAPPSIDAFYERRAFWGSTKENIAWSVDTAKGAALTVAGGPLRAAGAAKDAALHAAGAPLRMAGAAKDAVLHAAGAPLRMAGLG